MCLPLWKLVPFAAIAPGIVTCNPMRLSLLSLVPLDPVRLSVQFSKEATTTAEPEGMSASNKANFAASERSSPGYAFV